MSIFRRKNCIHTASGIVALCKRLHRKLVVTELKTTKNVKGPLWQCLVCTHDVLYGDVIWNFKLSDFNEETTSSLRMI